MNDSSVSHDTAVVPFLMFIGNLCWQIASGKTRTFSSTLAILVRGNLWMNSDVGGIDWWYVRIFMQGDFVGDNKNFESRHSTSVRNGSATGLH